MLRSELLPFKVIQGTSILAQIESAGMYIFLLVVNSNLDHILHHLRYTAAEMSKIDNFPYPTLFG